MSNRAALGRKGSRRRFLSASGLLGRRPTLLALLFLILGTLYLFHLGYRQERERVLESVRGEFHERLNALERATSLTSTQLTVLRRRAEDLMGGGDPGDGGATSPEGAIYEGSGDFFHIAPGGSSRPSGERGSIFGVGRPREEAGAFMKDLSLAAALLPLLKVSCDTSETMKSCYFFSNSLLSATYPSVDPRMLAEHVSTDGTLKGAFDVFYRPHEGQYRDPGRGSYWTDVYLDRTGLGLMVTHATPLYDGERFVGIIAVDVTLGYLERFVSDLGGPSGRVLITSGGGKVLADSAVEAGTVTGEMTLLGDRLPFGMRESSQDIIKGEGSAFSRLDGHYAYSRAIEAAPWTMIYLMDKSDLTTFLSLNRIVLVVGSVTLVYLFLLFSFAHRQIAAERARHEAEKKYRAIFDHQLQLIGLLNPEGTLLSVNDAALSMIEEKEEEVLGRPLWETPWWRHSPDQQEKLKEEIARAAAGTFVRFEATHIDKGGSLRFVDFSLRPIEDDDGRVSFIIPEGRDITETKLTELRYQILFETAGDAIFIMSKIAFIECNRRALEIFGCPSYGDMIGQTPLRFSPPRQSDGRESEEKAREKVEKAFAGEPQVFDWTHCRLDGTPFDAEVSLNLIKIGEEACLQAIVRDVTDRKRIEEQLVQSQKMEAIGTLAGGIAHDFNNILAAIMGFTELAKIDAAGNEKVEESLAQVELAGGRARDLVAQILAFSRQTKKEPAPVQPKMVVMEVLKLLRASLPTTIEIKQDLNSDSSIIADPTQLHQVLMNLCTNAAHAMREEGGTLSVSLDDVDLGAEFVAGRTGMAPGRHLLLTVGDTGHGMTAETADRIFDPFFTTKSKEEGTGMGLSVVHGIVRGCGGAITVESRPGEGTEFSLFFPVAGEKDAEAGAASEDIGGGTERILFVDDEVIQGGLAREGLGRFGYRVTAVTDPVAALALFQQDPRAFDLVVTDMTMPKMTGDILAKRIMLAREDIPVILSTGFSERIDEAKTKAMGIRKLVFKPMVSSDLARIIRNILDDDQAFGDLPAEPDGQSAV